MRRGLLLLLLLTACAGGPNRAPVEERGSGVDRSKSQAGHYSVRQGETLYAIAWRFGYDYRKLAQANAIAAPYTIYPGQQLLLSDKVASSSKTTAPKTTTPKTTAAKTTVSKTSVTKTSSSSAKVKAPASDVGLVKGVIDWHWPTSGKIVRGFSGDVHKGIDIGGKAGDSVKAVAGGRVVYAGSGIVGYGNLLIVKHSEIYLSAYGHNRRLLVAEGDVVKQGQRIAEKGKSATNSVKLHFEIRREGNPVNPNKLLPKA
jgi:lipoprotein NlpD